MGYYLAVIARNKETNGFQKIERWIGHGYYFMTGWQLPGDVYTVPVPEAFQKFLLEANKYEVFRYEGMFNKPEYLGYLPTVARTANVNDRLKNMYLPMNVDQSQIIVMRKSDFKECEKEFKATTGEMIPVVTTEFQTCGKTDNWFAPDSWNERLESLKEDIRKRIEKDIEWKTLKNSLEYRKLSEKEKLNIQCEFFDQTHIAYGEDGKPRSYDDLGDDPDYEWGCIEAIHNLQGMFLTFEDGKYETYGCIYSTDNVIDYDSICTKDDK